MVLLSSADSKTEDSKTTREARRGCCVHSAALRQVTCCVEISALTHVDRARGSDRATVATTAAAAARPPSDHDVQLCRTRPANPRFLEESRSAVPPQLASHEAAKTKPGSVDARPRREQTVFAKH